MRVVAIVLLLCVCGIAAAVTLSDLEGRPVQPLAAKTTVLVFTRTDCPISNRYAPEVRRIHARYAPQGVSFWLVYVDPNQPVPAIRSHIREYGYTFGAVLDPKHELVKLSGVSITPEVAVFSGRRLVYRGRIDDRYLGLGKMRPAATTHDLENVLAALVKDEQLAFRGTPALGCFIEDLK